MGDVIGELCREGCIRLKDDLDMSTDASRLGLRLRLSVAVCDSLSPALGRLFLLLLMRRFPAQCLSTVICPKAFSLEAREIGSVIEPSLGFDKGRGDAGMLQARHTSFKLRSARAAGKLL